MKKPLYKRELSHSYLVMQGIPQEERNRYPYRMVLKNRIPGLLSCSERFPEGEACLYYDISSRQSLGQLYESARIGYAQIRGLVDNLAQVQDTLAEYLLEEGALILEPSYIYMDLESEQLFFLYDPFMEERNQEERLYLPLAEFLLEHVDHREEKAAHAAYRFYKMSKAENFTIESFRTMLERDVQERQEESLYAGAEAGGAYFQEASAVYEYGAPPERDTGEEAAGCRESACREKEVQEVAAGGLTGRPGWIAGLLAAGLIFAGLCGTVWYLQPTGQVKICLFCGLFADGLALLFFLWKTITGNTEGGRTEMTAQEGPESGKGKHVKQAEFDGTSGMLRKESCENSYAETLLCGPTVFFGEREEEEEWKREMPHRPRPRLVDGKREDREYPLSRLPVMVGKMRSRAQILLPDASVSRIHARFVEKEGRIALLDLNSTNGTYVNGIRLEQEETVLLENGDEILFGNMAMKYLE